MLLQLFLDLGLKSPSLFNPSLSRALLAVIPRVMCSSDGSSHAVVAWSKALDTGRRPDGSVGMALVLPALTDCRWWFESLLVHSGVSTATRRKATGADQKKKALDTGKMEAGLSFSTSCKALRSLAPCHFRPGFFSLATCAASASVARFTCGNDFKCGKKRSTFLDQKEINCHL